jgi:hypothetical protein
MNIYKMSFIKPIYNYYNQKNNKFISLLSSNGNGNVNVNGNGNVNNHNNTNKNKSVVYKVVFDNIEDELDKYNFLVEVNTRVRRIITYLIILIMIKIYTSL